MDLDDKLYFLFAKLGIHILRSRHQIHETTALPDSQIRILQHLMDSFPRPLNHTDLADSLLVSKPNITGIADRMEKAGLIRRVASATDKRIATIMVTAQGRKAYRGAHPSFQKYKRECFTALTKKEKSLLKQLLQKMADDLEKDKEKKS